MNIGEKITMLKKQRQLSTNKLASMAGIAQSTLRSIEIGEKSPTIDTLSRILNALNVTMSEFFTETTQPIEATPQDQVILEEIKTLSKKDRELVETIIRIRKSQEASAEGET